MQAHAERLASALSGMVLERVEPLSFAVLKTYRPAVDGAVGHALAGVGRRGKYLLLDFDVQTHVVHFMQGGRLKPDPKPAKKPRFGQLRWWFAEGAWLLTEAGTERKAGVWAVEGDPLSQVPLHELGPEADTLDAPALLALAHAHPARLHTFLRDQRVLAGIGRRLANEVCFLARLSPFAPTARLDLADAERVAGGIATAVADSLAEERDRDAMSSSKDRTSLVHQRTGEPCTACGDAIRAVEYRAYTVNYCPTCQTAGKILADNTTSKFLK